MMEWKKWFRTILARLRALRSGGVYYIGGSEVLPPPLVGQEEADCIARLMAGTRRRAIRWSSTTSAWSCTLRASLRTPVWASWTCFRSAQSG